MYNIKVGVTSNGQYYAAGMGIGVENTPSGMQSQVIFLADRFAVTAAGNSVALPFVIQNGQTFIGPASFRTVPLRTPKSATISSRITMWLDLQAGSLIGRNV
jgi:predicted phage tail protein